MRLPKWFENRLKTIMVHNNYGEDWVTTAICESHEKWTPCDLVIREVLNNGGGSSKGFLGLTRGECYRCYDFIKANKSELIAMDYINRDGWNSSGFPLWKDWGF